MSLCRPCREDDHDHHRSHEVVSFKRKGKTVGSHRVECDCPCLRPAGWRGEAQPVPKWERA